jgi:hypothetical protein
MMPGAKISNPKKGWVEVQSIESSATIQRHSYNLAGTATSRESAWKLSPQINTHSDWANNECSSFLPDDQPAANSNCCIPCWNLPTLLPIFTDVCSCLSMSVRLSLSDSLFHPLNYSPLLRISTSKYPTPISSKWNNNLSVRHPSKMSLKIKKVFSYAIQWYSMVLAELDKFADV